MSRDLAIEVQLLCIGLEIMLDKIVDLGYLQGGRSDLDRRGGPPVTFWDFGPAVGQ